MTKNDGRINVLCENYDEMTDEGKNELLMIGENYLREIISNEINSNKKIIGKGETDYGAVYETAGDR